MWGQAAAGDQVKPQQAPERRSTSPMRYLPPEGKRALVALGVLAGLKALALVLIAEAVARGVVSVIEGTDAWRSAIWLGLAGGAIRAIASWLTDVVAIRTASVAKAGLRARLAERWVSRGGRDLDARIGETTTLATTGLDTLDTWYATVLPAMAQIAVVPLLVWVRILWADWISALIVLLTVPLIPVFMILIGYQTRDRVAEAADSLGRLSNQLLELARGLPVLVGLGQADAQIASLREISDSLPPPHRRNPARRVSLVAGAGADRHHLGRRRRGLHRFAPRLWRNESPDWIVRADPRAGVLSPLPRSRRGLPRLGRWHRSHVPRGGHHRDPSVIPSRAEGPLVARTPLFDGNHTLP